MVVSDLVSTKNIHSLRAISGIKISFSSLKASTVCITSYKPMSKRVFVKRIKRYKELQGEDWGRETFWKNRGWPGHKEYESTKLLH